MHDTVPYAAALGVAAIALLFAVASGRLTSRTQIPGPAIFLLAASIAVEAFPGLGSLSVTTQQRVVTLALIVLLFDGGLHIGVRRFRPMAGLIVWVGVAGTFATAAGLAALLHWVFGFDWRPALLLATSLSPTDPATVFSVLGRREITGDTGTLLEGEAGANDPVGIALMVSIIGATGGGGAAVLHGAGVFVLQLLVGAAGGLLGGIALRWVLRRSPLPNDSLHHLRALAFAVLIYAGTTVAEGSGFLAVLLAGILVGDVHAPYKRETEGFVSGLASLAEIVAFTVLGLSLPIGVAFGHGHWWVALGIAAVLTLVVRPVLMGLILLPLRRFQAGERLFVLWSGLKGVVPILLGTYLLSAHEHRAHELYAIIFVVVLLSVSVQGTLVPTVARWCRVPMHETEPEPWATGMRFRERPRDMHRYVVRTDSRAAGTALRDLSLDESVWVSMVSRHGTLLAVTGDTTLAPGDEVLVITPDPDEAAGFFGARA